jgi:hypothetical protein
MGLEDLIKEGEQALDGQNASNQQAQNQQSGSGNESKEDTMIDSGKIHAWCVHCSSFANNTVLQSSMRLLAKKACQLERTQKSTI